MPRIKIIVIENSNPKNRNTQYEITTERNRWKNSNTDIVEIISFALLALSSDSTAGKKTISKGFGKKMRENKTSYSISSAW